MSMSGNIGYLQYALILLSVSMIILGALGLAGYPPPSSAIWGGLAVSTALFLLVARRLRDFSSG
jgi:hypothetical protein